MRKRIEILKDLISLRGSLNVLQKELSQFSWDTENPIQKINLVDFSNVLKRCIDGEIDFVTLTNWANAIECRDDLEFTSEKTQEILFELANPEINGEITKNRLNEIIFLLEDSNS